jgi:hypothetical protein
VRDRGRRGELLVEEPVTNRPIPREGLDLLQELRACQDYWLEKALHRTGGDRSAAAKLLGTNVFTLDWLQKALAPPPELSAGHINRRSSIRPRSSRPPLPPSEAPTLRDLPKHREPSKVAPAELGRIEQGVLKIDPAVIRRLADEGFTPKEISRQLGVHFNFVEKVLREGGPT